MKNKTLFDISPNEISPNPNNPRMFFEEASMTELKKSIKKVGILVPLTVYPNRKKVPKTKYILLDGERRWRIAKELNEKTVPANVIEEPKDITQNILFMFNIHHYREEWELFPTALKLEAVIKALKADNDAVLSQFTGVKPHTIRRCRILLWFPLKYRSILMIRKDKISTDFFIELYPIAYRLAQEPEYLHTSGLEKMIDRLMIIFRDGQVIEDVKEFREIRKSMGYYDKIGDFNTFKQKMSDFLKNPEVTLDIFISPELEADVVRKNILRYASYLNANLKDIDSNIISDLIIVEQLETLKGYIDEILIKTT